MSKPVFALCLMLLMLSGCGGTDPASALAMLAALQKVDATLEQTEGTVNTAASDRIHQLHVEIQQLIDGVSGKGGDLNRATSYQREEFVRQGTLALQQASDIVGKAGAELTSQLNKVLVAEAYALHSIPFIGSNHPFILATDPMVIDDVTKPIPVRAYAFLPGNIKATAISAHINDQAYTNPPKG